MPITCNAQAVLKMPESSVNGRCSDDEGQLIGKEDQGLMILRKLVSTKEQAELKWGILFQLTRHSLHG